MTVSAQKRSPRHCEPTGRANARPMTGSSEAIQKLLQQKDWIASSQVLLAMTLLQFQSTPQPSPRACAVSSTPRLIDSITDASEYWIARWSLSSGGASADPVADDDG